MYLPLIRGRAFPSTEALMLTLCKKHPGLSNRPGTEARQIELARLDRCEAAEPEDCLDRGGPVGRAATLVRSCTVSNLITPAVGRQPLGPGRAGTDQGFAACAVARTPTGSSAIRGGRGQGGMREDEGRGGGAGQKCGTGCPQRPHAALSTKNRRHNNAGGLPIGVSVTAAEANQNNAPSGDSLESSLVLPTTTLCPHGYSCQCIQRNVRKKSIRSVTKSMIRRLLVCK
jgi:hypothetical protein